jgi:hypothetical protein
MVASHKITGVRCLEVLPHFFYDLIDDVTRRALGQRRIPERRKKPGDHGCAAMITYAWDSAQS